MPTKPLEEREEIEDVATEEPAKVILFNDEVHTFDEVILQLMKAIKCIQTKAEALAWEVHNNGKTVVYTTLGLTRKNDPLQSMMIGFLSVTPALWAT